MDNRYYNSYWPVVQECPSCGKTMRPVHRDPLPLDKVFCPVCGGEVLFETHKPTHYDKIRAMSEEELAEYLFDRGNGSEYCYGICAYQDRCRGPYQREFCLSQIETWLKSPVEVEE